jgi:hypothetical protein
MSFLPVILMGVYRCMLYSEKVEEMEIQTVRKKNEEGRRSSSSVFFHRTFSYFYKFLLVNF